MSKDFSSVKAIFFDTGDTLYTSDEMEKAYPQKLTECIAKGKGLTHEEAKKLIEDTTDKLKGTVRHITKVRVAAELGFARARIHEAFCTVNPKDFLNKDPGLDLVMARLAQKYKLGIISNFKRSHIIEILNALGLSSEWFPLLVTEDIVTEVKPDPEPFLKAIKLSGYMPNECLYVGDSPTKDMWPAKEVGMMTVLVAQNPTSEEMKYADASIPDVKAIVELLGVS